MTEREPPRPRAAYAHFEPVQTRWNDNDQFGHLYNIAYLELFDSAMNGWMIPRGMLDHHGAEAINVVVENRCTYLRELAFPDPISIGIRLARLGRSSFGLELGMFRDGDATEAARAAFTLVCVDPVTRTPVPVPPRQRDLLAALRVD